MLVDALQLVLLGGEKLPFVIHGGDLTRHIRNTMCFWMAAIPCSVFERLAGFMVSNLLSTPRHPIADFT